MIFFQIIAWSYNPHIQAQSLWVQFIFTIQRDLNNRVDDFSIPYEQS